MTLFSFFEKIEQSKRGRAGIEPATSRTRSENHTTRPTAHAQGKHLRWLVPLCTVCICSERMLRLGTKPPWPNGQGAPLLRVRLWVRVPLGVIVRPFFATIEPSAKKNTPCGTQTHNLQIRSLTRYSVAPTGRNTYGPRFDAGPFGAQTFEEAKHKNKTAPGGTRTPDPGLIRPMLYQTEFPERMLAHARDRTKDLQFFSLTLSQLSYMGVHSARTK